MKKLLLPMLCCALLGASCNKQHDEEDLQGKADSLKATILTLSIDDVSKKSLFITDDKGLKSTALEFSSTLEIGDTIFWRVKEGGDILSIEDIIIVTSDCEANNLFAKGIIFNEDKTQCYAVISEKAFGSFKYDIAFKFKDGKIYRDDPEVDIRPPDEDPKSDNK